MMGKKKFFNAAAVVLAVWIGFMAAGCGKKGPPLPPENRARQVAAPYGLKVIDLGGGDVRLVWKHETNDKTAVLKPEFFEIFMAKKTFEACEGCPFEFESAGRVDAHLMEFFVPVEKGFRYYFRLQAVDPDNIRSPYSQTVQFENK